MKKETEAGMSSRVKDECDRVGEEWEKFLRKAFWREKQ